MRSSIEFEQGQFDRLFPFYILLAKNLRIEATGRSLKKLGRIQVGHGFNDSFTIVRPYTPAPDFSSLLALQHQLVVLETRTRIPAILRGQFEYLPATDEVLFIGSPWLNSVEELKKRELQINDFAHHDPLIDLLHVLKTQEITNTDMKNLVITVNQQKHELKKAHKEVHDIALFAMQNPDPLIRISFEGEVLKNNPPAALLKFFELDGVLLRDDEFFKFIAISLDKQHPRWSIEALANDKVFSFFCVAMLEEAYINIYGRDITEKKQNEDRLARLSLVASANQNGVLFIGLNGCISWANEGFCRLTGYLPGEVVGRSLVSLCQELLLDEASRERIQQLFSADQEFNTDIIIARNDGSWFWGHAVSQPIRNAAGEITEYFGIIQDVTADKATEERLKILSKIAEDNIHAVIIADKDGRITYVNKSFTILTGYTSEEVLGRKPGSLLQGAETDTHTVQYIGSQLKKGESFHAEIINYHKSGRKYWIRIQGQTIKNTNGLITGYFALEEDITKEKESERHFRKALENIGDNVWEHDFKTGTTYFSKSDNHFLGFTTNELTNNQELWWTSVHPDDQHLLQEADRQYKACTADVHSMEYRVMHRSGEVRWVLDRGVVIERDGQGNPTKIVGTHVDVTRQKNLETELKRAKENAEASTRVKEAFLANMSHEIRTPMNAIMGMSNQLAKTSLTEQQRFYLQPIRTAADNLLVIINDILDLSKIEAGKLTLEKIGFDPRGIIENALQVLQLKAQEKGLRLISSFRDPRLAGILIGDPYRFTQVLLNLLNNAVKFTEKGEVDLTCAVILDNIVSQTIQVCVRDTGIGMDETYVEKLFEKFSQEYESTSRTYGGTGLGMSICKELISLMGGHIHVKSRKGMGTTVILEVEFLKGKLTDLPIAEARAFDPNFLQGKTILIADDNALNRLVAATILQGYGARIQEAADGLQAIDRVDKEPPHLILMDIQMPFLNGYEAVQQLRLKGYTMPIIALTANAIRGENEKCKAAGMNDYIAKPFKEQAFLGVIAHWLPDVVPVERPIWPAVDSTRKEAPVFDLSALELLSQGNKDVVRQLLELFLEQGPETVGEIRRAYEQGDIEAVSKLAHRLKPSIDILGIQSLQVEIRELESNEHNSIDGAHLDELIKQVESVMLIVVSQIKLYLTG